MEQILNWKNNFGKIGDQADDQAKIKQMQKSVEKFVFLKNENFIEGKYFFFKGDQLSKKIAHWIFFWKNRLPGWSTKNRTIVKKI
jgi:hypothetical protein